MQSSELLPWKFNPLFEKYSMQDAIKKASEMEEERAVWSQVPLLPRIYSKGWKEWQDMPGAGLVGDLIQWWEDDRKDSMGLPWYPNPTNCELVAKGEMSLEDYQVCCMRRFCNVEAGETAGAIGLGNAYLQHERDLRELILWWRFDEQTHQEMDKIMNIKLLGIPEEKLLRTAINYTERMAKSPMSPVTKENIKTLNRFQVVRDGPPLLMGCIMLAEIENPWSSQRTRPALVKYYNFPNEALLFVNVHTFIDYYHIRLGQYILAKYATTNELRELCKAFFINTFKLQHERAAELFKELSGKKFELTLKKEDTYLQ